MRRTTVEPVHDDFPNVYAQTFHVRYDECGPDRAVRAAVHLRLFQEIAFAHSGAVGFPLAWYEEHRLFWVVRRLRLIVHARAQYGDALTYTTRIVGARRILARRVSTARRVRDETAVATGVTDWVFTHDGAAPARINQSLATAFPAMARPVAPRPLDEPEVPADVVSRALRVRAGDLDGMGHVNNPVYLDLLDDAVVRAGGHHVVAAHPRTYNLQFAAGARADDALRDRAWREGDRWHYRLEHADGRLVAHGRLVAGEMPPDP
ncbi:MAG: thioesterase [Armatimonadota bacterium]|nr:thioesterase [Armatimonadota bacterium]